MKFVTYQHVDGSLRSGWIEGNDVVDMEKASYGKLPNNLLHFLQQQEEGWPLVHQLHHKNDFPKECRQPLDQVILTSPLPCPPSVRDFYAFEEHVRKARQNRGLDMVPEWYEFPAFYFTNHHAIQGSGEVIKRPKQCRWLDYELEIACVIGRKGRDIPAEEAESYIFGYCIMNDWSARDIQIKEMKVGLGPAKGKDFATSLGPWLVTKDELEPFRVGDRYDLEMSARVNGQELSRGNMRDLHFSFPRMIQRASEGATLYPGDVIGSGTVGTGCILELGTEVHPWLQPGDEVELSITGLGVLHNRIEE